MASDAESSMWKSYIAAIKGWCGGGENAFDSNSRVIFVASTQERGIAAGQGVPVAATNYDLYQKADSLLKGNSVWYNPATAASYVVELKTSVLSNLTLCPGSGMLIKRDVAIWNMSN